MAALKVSPAPPKLAAWMQTTLLLQVLKDAVSDISALKAETAGPLSISADLDFGLHDVGALCAQRARGAGGDAGYAVDASDLRDWPLPCLHSSPAAGQMRRWLVDAATVRMRQVRSVRESQASCVIALLVTRYELCTGRAYTGWSCRPARPWKGHQNACLHAHGGKC